MKKILSGFIFLILTLHLSAKPASKRPKVVIGIVIDQMMAEYLYLFEDKFGTKGFNRLRNGGCNFKNTYINYLPSYTGPGHACIYTGSVPNIHGIAGNDWYDYGIANKMYCVNDNEQRAIGGIERNGRVSPKNLWTTTITDQLKLSQANKSKTIAISLKDRGAVLPGGHTANAAYWMDDSLAEFMTSSFYMNSLPLWVKSFNQEQIARQYLMKGWKNSKPLASYLYSQKENHPYIGRFANQDKPIFPFDFSGLNPAFIKKTPYGNDIVFDFAKRAIENENLGGSGFTDFLALSFSSTDYIGHHFGPHSMEIEDTYLRLDIALANFLAYLDKTYGLDNYLLFLTSDHGALSNPNYLKDRKVPADFVFAEKLKEDINKHIGRILNIENAVVFVDNNQVYLNKKQIAERQLDEDKVANAVVDYLLHRREIHFCFKANSLGAAVVPEVLKQCLIHSYNRERSGDILYVPKPAFLDAYSTVGTSHGAWGPYDTKIPLLFYGWNIPYAEVQTTVYMTDISATLANLLNITPPNGNIGKALLPFNTK